jgi:hypothetical protein
LEKLLQVLRRAATCPKTGWERVRKEGFDKTCNFLINFNNCPGDTAKESQLLN